MADGIRWAGAGPVAAAAALRAAQDDVRRAVADTALDLPGELRRTFPAAARDLLPRRGGLADLVAASQLDVSQDTAGDSVSVTVRATSGRVSLGPINGGDLRHPVWGTGRWVRQRVRPGVWDRACETATRGSDRQLRQQLQGVARDTASRAQ